MASDDQVLAIRPDLAPVHSNKIFVMDFTSDLGFEEHQLERRKYAQIQSKRIPGDLKGYSNDRNPSRPLVLGYVSADFKHHSAAFCFGPVLRHHDAREFRVICYSGVRAEDEWTEAFRQLADPWQPVAGLSDDELAEQIRADGVDILIDLSGHSQGNRLPVFARKPAPIQVTAWGHGGGTGLSAVDYQFTDPVFIPERARPLFTERCFDLPCCITFEAPEEAPEVGGLPAEAQGCVTFGSLNRFSKVSPQVFDLWTQILDNVPGSRLLIKDVALGDPAVQQHILDFVEARGISADRIEMRGPTPRLEHLAAYNRVDIVLDTFPQNGGISTWEALWMGAPVLAMLGNSPASRISGAILHALGEGEWVVESEAEYLQLAVEKAADLKALARFRAGIRTRIMASPAGNPERYTRAVEEAYRYMWKEWVSA
jgi:predicted O-linked N-acetylglucosamine transferase (SPINDLY family)